MRTDADVLYPKFLYLQAVGHALGKQSYCEISPDMEYFNEYILLVGDSFYARKNVSQDLALKLYPEDHILPNEFSPEAFIESLAARPKAILPLGEFSRILKLCKSGKGYLSPIIEIWNDLHRYKRHTYKRETKSSGEIIIDDPYLCINATCTEEVLKKYVDTEMLMGGFFGRFILVPGKSSHSPRKMLHPCVRQLETFFTKYFFALNKIIDEGNPAIFEFNPEALDVFNTIEETLRTETKVTAIAGKYGQTICALACLIAFDAYLSKLSTTSINSIISKVSKNSKNPVISSVNIDLETTTILTNLTKITKVTIVAPEYVLQAYELIKPCIELAKKVMDYSESDVYVSKMREYMQKNITCSRTSFMQNANTTKEQTNKAEETLVETEELYVFDYQKEHTKSKKFYCWLPTRTREHCQKCEVKGCCKKRLLGVI